MNFDDFLVHTRNEEKEQSDNRVIDKISKVKGLRDFNETRLSAWYLTLTASNQFAELGFDLTILLLKLKPSMK